MSSELVRVQFQGDEIEAVRQDGKVWVLIRRTCQALGIDDDAQRVKLQGKSWASTLMIKAQVDGQVRNCFCLDVESLPMWLATIDESRVAEHIRPKLVLYQRECAAVLRAHFAPRPEDGPSDTRAMRAMLALCTQALQQNTLAMQALLATQARPAPKARRRAPDPDEVRRLVLEAVTAAAAKGTPCTSNVGIRAVVQRRMVDVFDAMHGLLDDGLVVKERGCYVPAPARQTSMNLTAPASSPPMFTRCQACDEEVQQPAGARNLLRFCSKEACVSARRRVKPTLCKTCGEPTPRGGNYCDGVCKAGGGAN